MNKIINNKTYQIILLGTIAIFLALFLFLEITKEVVTTDTDKRRSDQISIDVDETSYTEDDFYVETQQETTQTNKSYWLVCCHSLNGEIHSRFSFISIGEYPQLELVDSKIGESFKEKTGTNYVYYDSVTRINKKTYDSKKHWQTD